MDSNDLVREWRDMGPVAWAEHSLGWIGEDGQPIKLYPWQRAVLEAWWSLRGTTTTLGISNIKKTGKTQLNAFLLCWRWLALPGEHFPVGNDLDQSAGRQFAMIADMVRRHPYLSANVTITRTQLRFEPTGSTLSALASDAAGNAGANHLTASHTEAWGILYEAGIRSWEELTPPPGLRHGLPAMRIADSYAGWEAESKTWHALVDRGVAGERISEKWPIYRNGGLLLFHAEGEEAQALCFPGTPEEAAAYYADQRGALRANAFLRMHQNKRVSGESRFIPIEWWERAATGKPVPADPSLDVVLGVDAGLKRDTAAVTAVAWDADTRRARLVAHRLFRPVPGETLDIEDTLEAAVLDLRQRFRVKAVRYDPWQFQRSAQSLTKAGVPMEEFAQSMPNLTAMSSNLYELMKGGNLEGYPDDDIRDAFIAAVAVEGSRGMKIAKEKASHKIDVVVSLAMAALGAVELLAAAQRASLTVVYKLLPDPPKRGEIDWTAQRMGSAFRW
ncbi:MAG: terminase large subunit [Bacteroidetes bacterium]|nr:terminase large subunit [Bacteroidota bacterium]